MAKTPTASTKDRIEDPILIAGDNSPLVLALAALKPFAHLPILVEQPDDAHPAFQIGVGLVREARRQFPDDFDAYGNPIEPTAEEIAPETDGDTLEGEVDVQPPVEPTT